VAVFSYLSILIFGDIGIQKVKEFLEIVNEKNNKNVEKKTPELTFRFPMLKLFIYS